MSTAEAADVMLNKLDGGMSFMLSFEKVSPSHRPLKWLSDALFNLTGIPASIHLYCSAAGSKVLDPHTDPYDVLVWQLVGSKAWRACVPRKEIASRLETMTDIPLSDAQRCLLQELAKDNIKGCTKYTAEDTDSLLCEDFVMSPGDVLYMPKGVVHYALTDSSSEAFHLTIGLHRENMQWLDVFHFMIEQAVDLPQSRRHGVGAVLSPRRRSVQHELMEIYSGTVEGVHLHEAVPGWLLLCLRPWMDESAAPKMRSCDELLQELVRIFRLHVERFGVWLQRLAREGSWKLAMRLAEKEKQPGDHADLQHVSHIFWWDGDLSFVEKLHHDEKALVSALQEVARVVDHDDTTRSTWKRRARSASRSLRVAGELGVLPTLCDVMGNWTVECRGSSPSRCEAHVARRTSCEQYCKFHGYFCEASWDDRDGACERARSDSASCAAVRTSQICACRRDCIDDGPWECLEEGCPSRLISCEMLSQACSHSFSKIWRRPPQGTASTLVGLACPKSCGVCDSDSGG